VHHPDAAGTMGERLLLEDGEAVVLGRGCASFSPPAFQSNKVSRKHAEVRLSDDAIVVRDLGSRNGTLVNGLPVEQAELMADDVLCLGGVMLLAHRGPRFVQLPRAHDIVGIGATCARIHHRIALAAPKDVSVLVRGETGVGKELVARAIHAQSEREGRFVALNCSSISDGVVQSELFGHARGAFSGAVSAREGLVAAAEGGTLFLDEIGDATASFQATLLRLLEQREYRVMGDNTTRHASARFVTATNVVLEQAVREGRFRADLRGRLERFVIEVPPLRERREDILVLSNHFVLRAGGVSRPLSRSLAHALIRHDWPANVRELQAVIEEALLEQPDEGALRLTASLAERLAADGEAPRESIVPPPRPSRRGVSLSRPSSEVLIGRFRELGCNASAMAEDLGVGRTTLYRWFREAGLDMRDLRED
jgi:two-component system NtrC family response regulator